MMSSRAAACSPSTLNFGRGAVSSTLAERGIDNGAYGLRLRPTDMQKLGILYLNDGAWQGTQIVSREWVRQSFTPWIRSRPDLSNPNYGGTGGRCGSAAASGTSL